MPNYAFTNCLNRIRITPKRTSYLNTYNLNQTVLTFFLISSILPHQVSRYNRRLSKIQIDHLFALPAWFLVRTVSPRLSNSIGLPALLLCIKKTLQKRKTASKYTHGDPTKKKRTNDNIGNLSSALPEQKKWDLLLYFLTAFQQDGELTLKKSHPKLFADLFDLGHERPVFKSYSRRNILPHAQAAYGVAIHHHIQKWHHSREITP